MPLPSRLAYHSHGPEGPEAMPGCDTCREKFEKSSSVCGFCAREVSNRDYFRNDYHQAGRCRQRLRQPPVPERTVDKPLPYPLSYSQLVAVDYYSLKKSFGMIRKGPEDFYIPEPLRDGSATMRDLAKWWKVRLKKWK